MEQRDPNHWANDPDLQKFLKKRKLSQKITLPPSPSIMVRSETAHEQEYGCEEQHSCGQENHAGNGAENR